MSKPTMASFFSGGGIADIGAIAAGFDVVKACEFNPNPKYGGEDVIANVYRKNIGDHCVCESITEVNPALFTGVDLMHFSPPCPNFSIAKTGGVETAEDIALAVAITDIFTHCRPRWVTVENVGAYPYSQSFAIILQALLDAGYQYKFGVVDAADSGVPQNRLRLILRAVLNGPVPPLVTTHCDRKKLAQFEGQCQLFGEDVLLPWNGWYGAIEDLLPGLPDSQFAPWQINRLPSELRNMLIGVQGEGGELARESDVPSPTITCAHSAEKYRALLVSHNQSDEPAYAVIGSSATRSRELLIENQQNCREASVRNGDEPMVTVNTGNTGKPSHRPMAFVCDGTTNSCGETLSVRDKQEPSLTVTATVEKTMPRAFYGAFYTDGQTGNGSTKIPIMAADEPASTVTSSDGPKGARIFTNGRIVKLSTRCLSRFQSIPDWYELPKQNSLAGRIIGNGLPSLLYQRIAESLLGVAK